MNAAFSSDTQAALFPEGNKDKEHLWEDMDNMTVSQVEEALLRRAQSPTFAQHIILKPCDLSKEMLTDIANKPHAIIISTDSCLSTVCSSFATTHILYMHADSKDYHVIMVAGPLGPLFLVHAIGSIAKQA